MSIGYIRTERVAPPSSGHFVWGRQGWQRRRGWLRPLSSLPAVSTGQSSIETHDASRSNHLTPSYGVVYTSTQPLSSVQQHLSHDSRCHRSVCRPRPTLSDRISQGAHLERSHDPAAPHHVLETCWPDGTAGRQRICCRPFLAGAPKPPASASSRIHIANWPSGARVVRACSVAAAALQVVRDADCKKPQCRSLLSCTHQWRHSSSSPRSRSCRRRGKPRRH